MDQERLVRQGKLHELKQKFDELDQLAQSDIIRIRQVLDPLSVKDNATINLDVDTAKRVVDRLQATIHEMRTINEQIAHLEDALGLRK